MSQLRKHNPVLERRLQQFLQTADADGLCVFLKTLSVADFRSAGYILADSGLPRLSSEVFWKFFLKIVPDNSKAYLGTFLKASLQDKARHALCLDFDVLSEFSLSATPVDWRKTLTALLPVQDSYVNVSRLVEIFCKQRVETVVSYLLPANSVPCYFVLFEKLKQLDATQEQLRRVCIMAMQQQIPLSFRFAAILKAYFGLEKIPGTLSLRIEPYKLGRLDGSFENFRKVMKDGIA